jgi:hypothetical protein
MTDEDGTPVTEVTVDIDGDNRDGINPDIGAYEYTADTPQILWPI